jgi:hypothetical protein
MEGPAGFSLMDNGNLGPALMVGSIVGFNTPVVDAASLLFVVLLLSCVVSLALSSFFAAIFVP